MEATLAPLLVLAVKSVSGTSLSDPKSCTVWGHQLYVP